MSVVWWNPTNKTINADTIATQGHFKYRETKLHSVGKWNFGLAGSCAIETYLRMTLPEIDDITQLMKKTVAADEESEIILYDREADALWGISVSDAGAISVYSVAITRCKAIGYGSPAVVVLRDMGMSDHKIGQMLLRHFGSIAGPFEQLDRHGVCSELTDDSA
jgi:hypothetical protein